MVQSIYQLFSTPVITAIFLLFFLPVATITVSRHITYVKTVSLASVFVHSRENHDRRTQITVLRNDQRLVRVDISRRVVRILDVDSEILSQCET